ncbi:hypothetical protein MHU86_12825 [Fragilaria crotonensis]|nr:hypothetical protein MHU86_12825 [Fragilaria crotonensis]
MSTRPNRACPRGLLRGREPNEEILSLRSQLEEERTTMQRLLQEQEVENAKKEEAMGILSNKFRRLQRTLTRMDKERKIATSGKERAEKENVHLRKLLLIRDKELQALNFHIAVSETSSTSNIDPSIDLEKTLQGMTVSPTVHVPSVNVVIPEAQVTKMMTNLELQLSIRDEHVENLNAEMKNLKTKMRDSLALERMLRESEGQQTVMKTQLGRMERDYEEVLTTVTLCFERMKSMSMNFKVKEAERNEIIWEANQRIVQQRAAHLKNCQNMARELYTLQVRVVELERLTGSSGRDDIAGGEEEGRTAVPLETLVLDNSRMSAFAFKQIEHDREIKRLTEEKEELVAAIHEEYAQQLNALHNTLLEKEQEIAELRDDISGQMNRMMNMSTEISRLEESSSVDMMMQDKQIVDETAFSDTYDSELDIDACLSEFDETSATSATSKKKKSVGSKALFSGSVNEDASVTLETRSLHTLREEEDIEMVVDTAKEAELSELRRDNTAMLARLSEVSEHIQILERRVETEEATVNLLKTNLDMMEQAMIEKDLRIRSLMIELRQKDESIYELSTSVDESVSFGSQGSAKDIDVVNLQTEIDVLKDKFKTESAIMQGMIRVLNGQVYQAMKALDEEQTKNRSQGSMPLLDSTAIEDVDERVAALEQDLLSLHKKSQMALQLSQAEVAALKSKLDRDPLPAGEPYTLGLDWLSPRKSRSPSNSPPGTPKR